MSRQSRFDAGYRKLGAGACTSRVLWRGGGYEPHHASKTESSQLGELVPLLKSPSATFSSPAAPGLLGYSVMIPTDHPRHDSRGRAHSGIISTSTWP